jgi:cell division protein ZapB
MEAQQFKLLEQQIGDLVRLCDHLSDENRLLKSKEANWQGERASLLEKNELAKQKVEAMIARLKSLEQGS